MAKKKIKHSKNHKSKLSSKAKSKRSEMKLQQWWKDKKVLGGIAAILLFTFILYFPSLDYELTNWDDDKYVTNNSLITDFGAQNLKQIWSKPVDNNYIPLTILSFSLNYQISGVNPQSYHLFNILFHLLNTFLVFYLIFYLTKGKSILALIVSMIFAIHPMHVESVAWITERKDVFYSIFFLLSLIQYTFYLRGGKNKNYIGALIFFVLSLLSKPAAIVLPLILLLLDFWEQRPFSKKLIFEKVPFFVLSIIFGIILLNIQSSVIEYSDLDQYNFFHKILFGSYGLMNYLFNFFIPINLSAFHPYPETVSSLPWFIYVAPLGVIAGAFLVYKTLKTNKIVAFGLLFYVLNLVLVLQVISVGNAITAERYTYIPYIGLALLFAYGYDYLQNDFSKSKPIFKTIAPALLTLFIAFWTYQSFNQIKVWKNSETLWTNVLETYPKTMIGYLNRGLYHMERQEMDKAQVDLNQAVQVEPGSYLAYYNRGVLNRRLNNFDAALADYDQAIINDANKPKPYNNRGGIYFNQQNYSKALENYNKFVELDPNNPQSYFNRAAVFVSLNQYENAIPDFEKSTLLDPYNASGHSWLGKCRQNLGRSQEAISPFSEAIRLEPNNGKHHLNRAEAYAAVGNKASALQDAQRAQQLGEAVNESFMNGLR